MQDQENQNQIHEKQKELLTHTFGQAMAYTNILMLGGYAGFFGLWQLTKEHLSKGQIYWSALMVTISLMFFVFFEIFKMIVNGKTLQSLQRAVDNPERFSELIANHRNETARTMRLFGKVWNGVLVISVGTGLASGGILIYSFICGLVQL